MFHAKQVFHFIFYFNFRTIAMSTTVKDLPKDLLIADGLKGELLKVHNLKPTEATEKNLLPTAEDVQQEKTHQNILTGKFLMTENS